MRIVGLFFFFSLWGFVVQAQTVRLAGLVKGVDGKNVSGARVELLPVGLKTVSDDGGKFVLQGLKQGKYKLSVSMIGYAPYLAEVELGSRDMELTITLVNDVRALTEVLVQDYVTSKKEATSLNTNSVNKQYIHKYLGGSLMHTLGRMPGVQMIGIGSGQSKPLIRGMGFNRVVVMDKGIKHEGQQWGADHGLEIDQFATGEIEILKGATSFMYGSDAIGGVINVQQEPFGEEDSIQGTVDIIGKSNNALYGTSLSLRARKRQWVYGGRLTYQPEFDY